MLKNTRRGTAGSREKNDRFLFPGTGRLHEGLSCSQQLKSKQPERRHQARPSRASPGPRAGLGYNLRHVGHDVGAARSRRFRVRPPCGTTASTAHCCVLCSSRRTTTGARGGDAEHRRLILPLSSERVVLRTCGVAPVGCLRQCKHMHIICAKPLASLPQCSSHVSCSARHHPLRPLPTCSSNSSPPHASLASASIAQLSAPHASPDHALGHDARPPIYRARASNPPTTT